MGFKDALEAKRYCENALAELERQREDLSRQLIEAEEALGRIDVSDEIKYHLDISELFEVLPTGTVKSIKISPDEIAHLYVAIFGEDDEEDEEAVKVEKPRDPLDTVVSNAGGLRQSLREVKISLKDYPGDVGVPGYYYRFSCTATRRVIVSGTLAEVMTGAVMANAFLDGPPRYTFSIVNSADQRIFYHRRFLFPGPQNG